MKACAECGLPIPATKNAALRVVCSRKCRYRRNSRLLDPAVKKRANERDQHRHRKARNRKKREWAVLHPDRVRRITKKSRDKHREQIKAKKREVRRAEAFLRFLARLSQIEVSMQATAENELDTIKTNVKAMSTETLQQEFAEGLKVTRDRLLRLSAVLLELESRGVSVEGDKHLLKLLRQIGSGSVLVDVVVRFAGRPYNLASIKRLPVEEQREILSQSDADIDIDNRFRNERKQRQQSGAPRGQTTAKIEAEYPFFAAEVAMPKDLAAMIASMILRHPDPEAVVEELWRQRKLEKYMTAEVT